MQRYNEALRYCVTNNRYEAAFEKAVKAAFEKAVETRTLYADQP